VEEEEEEHVALRGLPVNPASPAYGQVSDDIPLGLRGK